MPPARRHDLTLIVECNPALLGGMGMSQTELLGFLEAEGFFVFQVDEAAARLSPRVDLLSHDYVNLVCVRGSARDRLAYA